MTANAPNRAFANPYDVKPPEGCADYAEMYPYYLRFNESLRTGDEDRFWFFNGMHFPEPVFPFDIITADSPYMALGQINTRIFAVPPALGIEHRVLNGYVYISSNSVLDPEEIGRRAQLFLPRAGYYYRNWDDLYARWIVKVEAAIRELSALEVPQLEEFEPESVVMDGVGFGSTYQLMVAYNRLLESIDLVWQYHFEFLNLGYAAYLTFTQVCRQHFPDITDQSMARMVGGVEVTTFRPDEELKKAAREAVRLGIGNRVEGGGTLEDLEARVATDAAGRDWMAQLRSVMDPWFYFSYGNGFYHHHRSWIDDPRLPVATIGSYVHRLTAGEDIARPVDEVRKERDRIAAEYRGLLPDDDSRQGFDEALGLARTVFPYVESHNFYVEHWYHTIFWNKVREFGALLARFGFFEDADDVFYLQRNEVLDALTDLRIAWSAGTDPVGGRYWKPIVAHRKDLIDRLKQWTPPPALGPAPDSVQEPMTIMLWGVTTEHVQSWLDGAGASTTRLKGFAGSPGIAEGRARIVLNLEDLDRLEDGEILVAPVTNPSWTPIFGRIAAAVSDIGGVMSHAAIVAREYGLPAVVGTGFATTVIKTGQRIRVDGSEGVVTLLD
jgi:pyruvate,water dikinase